jgi:hypothetical protein
MSLPASMYCRKKTKPAYKTRLKKAPIGLRKESSSHTKKSRRAILLKETLTAEYLGGASMMIISKLGPAIAYEEAAKDIDEQDNYQMRTVTAKQARGGEATASKKLPLPKGLTDDKAHMAAARTSNVRCTNAGSSRLLHSP